MAAQETFVSKKALIIIMSILILVILSVVWFIRTPVVAHNKTIKPPVYIKLTRVTQKPLVQALTAVGSLAAYQSVAISADISGKVKDIFVQPGAHVTKGEKLIQLVDDEYQANLKSDAAQLTLSKIKLKRVTPLLPMGAISKLDYAGLQSTVKEQEAAVEADQALLNKMLLTAPFSGTVAGDPVNLGEHIDAGKSVFTLVNKHELYVSYQLPENNLAQIKLGQQVTITTGALPGRQFKGVVNYISPTINIESRTVIVHANITNTQQQLSPGLFVKVEQVIAQVKQALWVPQSSLVVRNGKYFIYQVVNKRVTLKPVTIGTHDQNRVRIVKGVVRGEQIVTSGFGRLHDGAKIIRSGK